jgi:hypothetical protein
MNREQTEKPKKFISAKELADNYYELTTCTMKKSTTPLKEDDECKER